LYSEDGCTRFLWAGGSYPPKNMASHSENSFLTSETYLAVHPLSFIFSSVIQFVCHVGLFQELMCYILIF
jgi:hypothetical protein